MPVIQCPAVKKRDEVPIAVAVQFPEFNFTAEEKGTVFAVTSVPPVISSVTAPSSSMADGEPHADTESMAIATAPKPNE
jgi:hypothetical protein